MKTLALYYLTIAIAGAAQTASAKSGKSTKHGKSTKSLESTKVLTEKLENLQSLVAELQGEIDGIAILEGAPGADGQDGATGPAGPTGATGTDGAPGMNGTPGTDGVPGATGPQGAPGLICSGVTTAWEVGSPRGITIYVDTSHCDFASTPKYFTSLSGTSSHWTITGIDAIYEEAPDGFRLFLDLIGTGLSTNGARAWNLKLNWMAIE